MNYEEKYNDLLSRIKRMADVQSDVTRVAIESLFHELKESEDEQHRKWILEYLYDGLRKSDEQFKDHFKCAISWLEKQGEHANFINKIQIGDKVTRNEDGVLVNLSQLNRVAEKQSEQKNENICSDCINRKGCINCEDGNMKEIFDRVEPKFHEGDWISNGDYTWKIVEVKPLDYILQSQDGNIVDDTISHVDEQFHSCTIEDAKDGDVLVSSSGKPFIFKGFFDNGPMAYGGLVADDSFWPASNSNWTTVYCKPSTKEQRDLLFQKMQEAGYEWDAENKQLRKIEQNRVWSEEDEAKRNALISLVEEVKTQPLKRLEDWDGYIFWLKSLKDRVQPQREWSEEDEYCRNQLIVFCENCMQPDSGAIRCANWLKSLKDRYTWRPSDEQMDALYTYIYNPHYFNSPDPRMELVESVYQDLKKLRGE